MVKTRILIFGSTGMLGHKLVQVLSKNKKNYVVAIYKDKKKKNKIKTYFQADFIRINKSLDQKNLIKIFKLDHYDYVINCLGIIKQKDSKFNKKKIIEINSIFPQNLYKLSKKFNFKVIHFSTDCVFSGKRGNYTENDYMDAKDLYGISKIRGEANKFNKNVLTLRTSFIGHEICGKKSLLDWFIYNPSKNINGYSNAFFSGLTSLEIANFINLLIKKSKFKYGLYHFSGKKISKFKLLNFINRKYGLKKIIHNNSEFKIDRSLNNKKLLKTFDYKMSSWNNLVNNIFKDYKFYKTKIYLK